MKFIKTLVEAVLVVFYSMLLSVTVFVILKYLMLL